MRALSHQEQQRIWEEEHRSPKVLLQMDQEKGSSSMRLFWDFLKDQPQMSKGIEMGCGKGRNLIWLAGQGESLQLWGFDFSASAIYTAKQRSRARGYEERIQFEVKDATQAWGGDHETFDFGIDCTATTDMESPQARSMAVGEMFQTLRQGAYLMVYVMSDQDEYHQEMIQKSPALEKGAFLHPLTGKFEKVFTEEELDELYGAFTCIKKQRVEKKARFENREYACYHHFRIYRKAFKEL